MGDRRSARRYSVYLPLQVFLANKPSHEVYSARLQDVSRSGIYFHSKAAIDPGTRLELTFALPTERDTGSVLIRASARALRSTAIEGEPTPLYGVAATIDRIDFVRPVVTNAA
jgi:PilZ domain